MSSMTPQQSPNEPFLMHDKERTAYSGTSFKGDDVFIVEDKLGISSS